MATIAKALSHAPETDIDLQTLKIVYIFCGTGLFVSLLFASYGVDLSPAFF